jgi:hypothetical protein
VALAQGSLALRREVLAMTQNPFIAARAGRIAGLYLDLYGTCEELFREYPLAISVNTRSRTESTVLIVQDLDEVRYFVLSREQHADRHRYWIQLWCDERIVEVETGDSTDVPDMFVKAVTSGVPIPRDGSLLGWKFVDTITALVTFYADYTPQSPQPSWSIMPHADTPEGQWPPFTGERFLGHWFWEHYWAGNVVDLEGLITRTPDTMFWAYTESILGSGSCVVIRDIKAPEGYILRRGCYVYDRALRAGKRVPQMMTLLNDYGKVDLASRF